MRIVETSGPMRRMLASVSYIVVEIFGERERERYVQTSM